MQALPQAWEAWRGVERGAAAASERVAASQGDEELWRHQLAEIEALAPEPDEEERLATRRSLLQNAERLAETLLAQADNPGLTKQERGDCRARARRLLKELRDHENEFTGQARELLAPAGSGKGIRKTRP